MTGSIGKEIELNTEHLVLKPLGSQYLDTVNDYALNFENTKYMCHLPKKNTAETLQFLQGVDEEWRKEEPAFYEFAVIYQGRHIGAVSIYFEQGAGELGWIIHRDFWGNGFATEAVKKIIEHFSKQGCRCFIAHCDTENAASCRVMEKLGMIRTKINGGRKNRSSELERYEYQYELAVLD